jgi:hypothetical protein
MGYCGVELPVRLNESSFALARNDAGAEDGPGAGDMSCAGVIIKKSLLALCDAVMSMLFCGECKSFSTSGVRI